MKSPVVQPVCSVTEKRATYFSVDIECSGVVPALYDMISLGAVAVAPDDSGRLAVGRTLYLEIAPVSGRVDERALAVCGLDIERLRREGLARRAALEALDRFVASETAPHTKPVFVGHNAPFDWAFVAYSYGAEGMENPFGYKALDTKALSMGVLGLHWFDTGKDVLCDLLGLPPEDMEQKHRADYDAEYQARILVGLLERAGWTVSR
jgi:DNA polymerase III alpha subunit (gram-positive type)